MKLQNQLMVSIPHAGEKVPDLCTWLKSLPEEIFFCDVDRFVDILYSPALQALGLPSVKTEWHRYAVDLNRFPEDVDAGSVEGSSNPVGKFGRGYHWQYTTLKQTLMKGPLSNKQHQELTSLIFTPFHDQIKSMAAQIRAKHGVVYHLDLHSMPSVGTSEHKDPGETRADIVVSDCSGTSASAEFVDLVLAAYAKAGLRVAYNWPYMGGRVTEQYGHPHQGHHTVQVELSRALYMDELTKRLLPKHAGLQEKLKAALQYISQNSLS